MNINTNDSCNADLPRAFATEVARRLVEAGFEALWAGGCVRDLLRGELPTDYDVATSARPEQVREVFGHRRTLPVGASFGVIIVLGPTKQHGQVEVATFRTDAAYSDGRHPDHVTFSNSEEDAQRRDFTINGMFYDPLRAETIDFVGGRVDLENRIVRAIGRADHRIAEDKLRMLRAIRFAARFEFEIEGDTYAAICRHAVEIAVVSRERMSSEMRKTLITPRSAWAVERWADTGLLQIMLPEIAQSWPQIRSDSLALVSQIRQPEWTVSMAAMLWPAVCGVPMEDTIQLVVAVGHRLRLTNEETDAIRFILQSQSVLDRADRLAWSRVQPTLADSRASQAVALVQARSHTGLATGNTSGWLLEKLARSSYELDPQPLITGRDLIEIGMKPGPTFSQILQSVRDQQLDGTLTTKHDAIEWLRANTV